MEFVSECIFCCVLHSYRLICIVGVRMKVTKMWKVYHVRMKVSFPASLPTFKVVLIYAMLCCIWSIALCGAETWTVWKVDKKFLESFEMWTSITRVKEDSNLHCTVKWRKANWIGHILHRNCPLEHIIEGNIEEMVRQWRRHKQLLDDLKEKRGYWKLKEQ